MQTSKDAWILVLDQGTTSTRAMLFDSDLQVRGLARKEIAQIYRQPGWVEQDANEIWYSVLSCVSELLEQTDRKMEAICAIGITNQRETAILWDKVSGLPVGRAMVWQSRQTADRCLALKKEGLEPLIHKKTGLYIDPYFSATKFQRLLDEAKDGRKRAGAGELLCGTVDAWLIWKLTGGAVHATDCTNASRTQLYNLTEKQWDPELGEIFQVPLSLLPEVKHNTGDFGHTDPAVFFGAEIPICGVAGDQQAALFGQQCVQPGDVKNSYGTGCFLLMQTGAQPVFSGHGLLTTIAWEVNGITSYALEGSVFVAGSAVQWLRDSLGLIVTAAESERLANQVEDTGGVVLVPAFVGLGAPYWDDRVRGAAFGLTRGTTAAHLTRAVLESIALQSADVLTCMEKESGMRTQMLRADGGASDNDLLMQMQADYTGVRVVRGETEATAKGAAMFAGLRAGIWKEEELLSFVKSQGVFQPLMEKSTREEKRKTWQKAVRAAREFV